MDEIPTVVKGPKCQARKDEDGEIRILYRQSRKKWVGLRLSFNAPTCALAQSLSRKESQEFLKLKPFQVRGGSSGNVSKQIFADRDGWKELRTLTPAGREVL